MDTMDQIISLPAEADATYEGSLLAEAAAGPSATVATGQLEVVTRGATPIPPYLEGRQKPDRDGLYLDSLLTEPCR